MQIRNQVRMFVPDVFKNNAIFSDKHRDDTFARFRTLQKEMLSQGFDLLTDDLCTDNKVFFNIYPFNIPKNGRQDASAVPTAVILSECRYILPRNYLAQYQEQFDYVFTWDDDLVDHKRYIKLNYSFDLTPRDDFFSSRDKDIVMIFGNKGQRSSDRDDLYSLRTSIISTADKKFPNHVDLFGTGWDRYNFSRPRVLRYLNHFSFITKPLRKLLPAPRIYKGKIELKQDVMSRYNFAICPENYSGQKGYITEKIWDAMVSGCIPIYSGPPNTDCYIPKNCRIDIKDFATAEDMFDFILGMSEGEIRELKENIYGFLNSPDIEQFTEQYFCSSIMKLVKSHAT